MSGVGYFFVALAGGVLGAVLAWLLAGRSASVERASMRERLLAREREIEGLNEQLAAAKGTLEEVRSDLGQEKLNNATLKTTLDEQRQQAEEKLKLLKEAKDAMQADFKNLANEIFAAKQKEFKEQSKEQLSGALDPLKEKIQSFEKQVKEAHLEDSKGRASLQTELKNLVDLNNKMSKEAINLTNALKGESKTQGDWGEVTLERVLEMSGLTEPREYETQKSHQQDGRRLQPDVIVHLPEGKDVIIDAKVSLTAYERFCSAEDEKERDDALKQHVESLRRHIKQLADKSYQNIESLHTPDFVLLFVPIEAAFSVAVTKDGNIFADAFARKIVIVAPTTLLATLRIIQNIWRYEDQNQNAQEIARRAGALYNKFVGFAEDLENVGKKIDDARLSWEGARNKLISGRGHLVGQAEKLKALGAESSKSLPDKLARDAEIEYKDEDEAQDDASPQPPKV